MLRIATQLQGPGYLLAFVSRFPKPLGEMQIAQSIEDLFARRQASPIAPPDDGLRGHVRDLLRAGGYKPTGRGKPSSEYLLRAEREGGVARINLAVDVCNIVSLLSGLPISVVDLSRAREPFRFAIAGKDAEYVFNASGQVIDVEGLLCLFDADGPCANAVKDSHRTKTQASTTETLTVIWGTQRAKERCDATLHWYRSLLVECNVSVSDVEIREAT